MDKVFESQKRLKKYNANRFAAYLLAVLMLFSALSTGSMIVHAEAADENVAQMPVYKSETEYEEADITMQQSPIEIGDNYFELIFRPYFGTSEMNELIAQKGDAAKVSIGIRLEWTDAEGNPQSEDLKYTEDMVKAVYTANSGKAFYIKATGIKSFENLKVTPLVKSEVFTSKECLGVTEEVTGSVEKAATIVLKRYGDTEDTTKVAGTGTVAIEAENVIIDSEVVNSKSNAEASGGRYAKIVTNGTAPSDATTEPDMGFEIIPDKDGTYYIWARVYREASKDTNSRAVYVSWADGAYSSVRLSSLGATQLRAFTWVKLDSKEVKANESLSVRFAAQQNNLWFDKFIVTTDGELTGTEDIFKVTE